MDGRVSVLSVVPEVSGVFVLFVSLGISENFVDVGCTFISVMEIGSCEDVLV